MFENIKRQYNGEYQFTLAKRGKWICPMCEHKTFVLYIDNKTGQPLNENVGRCDRANNCDYHYPPKQYFADNNIHFDKKKEYTPYQKPIQKPKPQPSYIDENVFEKSLQGYENNNFVKYLHDFFGVDIATKAIERYCIGTSQKGTVFWQIDLQGKIRAGTGNTYKSKRMDNNK